MHSGIGFSAGIDLFAGRFLTQIQENSIINHPIGRLFRKKYSNLTPLQTQIPNIAPLQALSGQNVIRRPFFIYWISEIDLMF